MKDFITKHFINAGEFAKSSYKLSDFDPDQIKAGIEVEHEHTDSEIIALKIALDHLAEFPDYYTRLAKMEEEAKEYWAEKPKHKK